MGNEEKNDDQKRHDAQEAEREAAQREHQARVGQTTEQVIADRVAAAGEGKSHGSVEETTLVDEQTSSQG